MSILKKPYTISVWDDVWNAATGKFEEQRVGIIGADNMLYQGRAIEPNLVRNVNGTKKFSFKMYKYFVDNETGERVENPFVGWLVSERKVKLQYNGKWYDFIVKNINENSSNYLYTYQLEDALVQELSKNGFGITLDTKLMNNMGTARKLATYVLSETDWDVSSEALVEKVEDNLVYVTIPAGTVVHKIIDQTDLGSGVNDSTIIKLDENETWRVLAFYTSCTNKPHRFQFIYIPEGYYKEDNNGKHTPSVPTDENQIINVKDCQYYCEINTPEAEGAYVQHSIFKQFYLPKDFNIVDLGEDSISNNHDTTISVWYRGYRYGFAQSAKYIPLLDRYCNEYTKGTTEYYGFVDNDYNSPTLLQNVITNTDFKGTTGWVGTYSGDASNAKSTYGATIEPVYGEFISNKFSSVVEQLSNGTYSSTSDYQSYLKVTFPKAENGNQGILINTGFYDNRTLIGEVDYNEEWYFNADIVDDSGATVNAFTNFDFALREVSFDPAKGNYVLGDIWATLSDETKQINGETIHFLKFNSESKKSASGYANVKIPEKDFKKKEVKLVITPKSNNAKTTYYIKDMQLFELILNDESKIIKPGDIDIEGVTKTTYRFFPAAYVQEIEGSSINVVTDAENISYENFDKAQVDYSVYKPKYNTDAQKVRSVDAKESNYFNILQSIAEKFEAWLELEIGRNDQGGITSKTVRFKNYAGKDNYASFRYGVNLKDIQRTYESKNIVTKLIVKQNSNEHAENGFCTIARAGANQTGENYIYDFRYYHDRGMLDKTEYVAGLYYSKNIYHKELVEAGPDIAGTPCATPKEHGQDGHNCYNLQNYFNRIKNLNVKIQDINDIIIPKQNELLKLKADLAVQEGLRDAALEGLEEVREDFQALTGVAPEQVKYDWEKIECSYPEPESEFGISTLNPGDWAKDATISENYRDSDTNQWTFSIELQKVVDKEQTFIFYPIFKCYYNSDNFTTISPRLSCTIDSGKKSGDAEYLVLAADPTASNIQSMLTEYATYMAQYNDSKVLAGYTAEDGTEVRGSLQIAVEEKEAEIKQAQTEVETLTGYKKELNKLFYSRYSRFIQEGTWIDEKYIDDNKYYADAQSVMYNSCYPQVAYTINVVALGALPGYEYFDFELGDKTYAVDPEFFGEDHQEAVIINELSENLDDPSRDQIKVQNFKNQFQDLFQKITATVQQTQYSSGSYEKAVALAEASAAVKSEFLQDAFNSASDTLSKAGQTSVKWGDNGITLTDSDTKNEMRLIGGAILMSVQDEDGQRKWKTGLTPEGISASLVTAGTVDTGKIQIKNGKDVTFLWNSFGISAFDVDWNNGEVVGTPDTSKFVRFDKHGIYGMDISANTMKDGMSWTPTNSKNIDKDATFALTWEGLKVTGNEGVVARIGKQDKHIIYITDGNGRPIFQVNNDGSSEIAGWTVSSQTGYAGGFYHDVKTDDGENPTHRFGLKIENGKDNRYAFYVKKFIPNQLSWDKPEGDLVFGVKYDGSMVATQGRVGNWTLGPIEGQVSGLYYSDNEKKVKSGLAVNPDDPEDPIFWAGYTGNNATPWGHNNTETSWDELTNFYVTGEGQVVCKNILATGGRIGGWVISEESISKNDVQLTTRTDIKYPSLINFDQVAPSLLAGKVSTHTPAIVSTIKTTMRDTIRSDDSRLKNEELTLVYLAQDLNSNANQVRLMDYKGLTLTGGAIFQDEIEILTHQLIGGVYILITCKRPATIQYRPPNEPTFLYSFTLSGEFDIVSEYEITAPKFTLLEDGSLYAQGAAISGDIFAYGGKMGAWYISRSGELQTDRYYIDGAPGGFEWKTTLDPTAVTVEEWYEDKLQFTNVASWRNIIEATKWYYRNLTKLREAGFQ